MADTPDIYGAQPATSAPGAAVASGGAAKPASNAALGGEAAKGSATKDGLSAASVAFDAAFGVGGQEGESLASALGQSIEAVVPRINIDIFCETAAFASTMQTVVKDRRMERAIAHLEMGGVDGALKRYGMRGTPHLIIVESADGGFGMFAELERLASVCGEETQVIVAGSSNDVALYRELLRQGVAEYLVTPSSPMQAIEAIASVYVDPEDAPSARIVSVVGAKGGVGSSILAHNLAWLMSIESEKETILVDLDIEFGTAALDFNVDVKHSVVDALADTDALDDVKLARLLYPQNDYLKLLPSPGGIHASVAADGDSVMSLIDTVRMSADLVVLDVPHRWSADARCALRQSDEIVIVATPDLACLRNLKSLIDWLAAERRNDPKPRLILNQVGVQKRPEVPLRDVVEVIGSEIDLTIPFDGQLFASALNNGQMFSEIAANHKIVNELTRFGRVLLGVKPDLDDRKRSMLSLNIGALASPFGGKQSKKSDG